LRALRTTRVFARRAKGSSSAPIAGSVLASSIRIRSAWRGVQR